MQIHLETCIIISRAPNPRWKASGRGMNGHWWVNIMVSNDPSGIPGDLPESSALSGHAEICPGRPFNSLAFELKNSSFVIIIKW